MERKPRAVPPLHGEDIVKRNEAFIAKHRESEYQKQKAESEKKLKDSIQQQRTRELLREKWGVEPHLEESDRWFDPSRRGVGDPIDPTHDVGLITPKLQGYIHRGAEGKRDDEFKFNDPWQHPGLQNISGDMADFPPDKKLTDPKLQTAIDYARSVVGKTPSDKDLRDYLKGTLDPRKYDWCTAFLNATLKKAGVAGTPSMMATSFLTWGRHVDPKDVRAGDVIITGEDDEGPQPGGRGHAAIVTGPVHKGTRTGQLDSDYAPTVSGNWSHRVKEADVLADIGTSEFRRALPSHRAQMNVLHVHTKVHVN